MAKQCIYCGHLLAKDDARFCNDCGRMQVSPANAGGGAAAPSAIKVKLPPREFTRDDSQSEPDVPETAASAPPVPPLQREQTVSPSSRMPKRPTRLNPPTSPTPAPVDVAKPSGEALAAMTRQTGSGDASAPTPAEELSTMVLPNWREELAQLRKEQEQTATASSSMTTTERKPERETLEPPPLPRRSPAPGTPIPPAPAREKAGPPTPLPRSQANPLAAPPRSSRVQSEHEFTRERTLNTPLQSGQGPRTPQPSSPPSTPLPSAENERATEAARRELRIKVWEQQDTIQHAAQDAGAEQTQIGGKKASAASAHTATDQEIEIDDLTTVNWQAPLTPFPATPEPPSVEEKKPSSTRGEQRVPAKEERPSPGGEKQDDIEDLPTARLAVPEVADKASPIKIERASTPAPSRWTVPPGSDVEVEDLPTRPLVASSPAPQPPAAPQTQSGERRAGQGPMEVPPPFAQKAANPMSAPGNYGMSAGAPPVDQTADMLHDPLASRTRPVSPNAPSGPGFNPASLPPLPGGPLSTPGLRPDPQGTQQLAPVSVSDLAPKSSASSVSTQENPANPGAKSPAVARPKRRAGRLIAVALVALVLLGGGAGVALNLSWITQYFSPAVIVSQPYQTYQNGTLGISLDYTRGWTVKEDLAHGTVHFADGTDTGQANLSMVAATGQLSVYLTQQATQLGVVGPKAAPDATIAGESWSALQGIVIQSGATYAIVLYGVQHNSHFYLLTFLAPQPAFANTDQSNFAHMRASFQFT